MIRKIDVDGGEDDHPPTAYVLQNRAKIMSWSEGGGQGCFFCTRVSHVYLLTPSLNNSVHIRTHANVIDAYDTYVPRTQQYTAVVESLDPIPSYTISCRDSRRGGSPVFFYTACIYVCTGTIIKEQK